MMVQMIKLYMQVSTSSISFGIDSKLPHFYNEICWPQQAEKQL